MLKSYAMRRSGFDGTCKALAVSGVLMREDIVVAWASTQYVVARFVSAVDSHNNGRAQKLWDDLFPASPVSTVNS